jgi:GT2 family glycosyltransferase
LATEYPRWTLVVIDNASNDGSQDWLKGVMQGDHRKVVHLESNAGYTGGYMEGLQGLDADVYVLLNSDVEVQADWLQPLNNAFLEDATVGALQPKILSDRRRDFFEYAGAAGGMVDSLGYPFCIGRVFADLDQDLGQYEGVHRIFWASGACLAVRSKVFWECGGLDRRFFAHMEEIDLCWRIQRSGKVLRSVSESVVYHLGGGSLAYGSPRKTYLNFRNSLFTLAQNLHTSELFPKIFARLVLDGVAGVYFVMKKEPRHTWAILRAHAAFYAALPTIYRLRKNSPWPRPRMAELEGVWSGSVWTYPGLGKEGKQRMAARLRAFANLLLVKEGPGGSGGSGNQG